MGTRLKPRPLNELASGSVVELRQGDRVFLVVRETPKKKSVIESWEDGLDITNRLVGRLRNVVEEMNTDVSALNKRLTQGIRKIGTKIDANQRLLDKLIKGHA